MDHNAEIAAAAKSILAPIGCKRKGHSRMWMDDHGWWVGIVEFQPSGWSKGSYLNVSASYLWKPAFAESTWSFDALIGPRPWHPAIKGESYVEQATALASLARDSLKNLRDHHRSTDLAGSWLQSQWNERNPWHSYHLGIAFGLAGQVKTGQRYFRLAIDPSSRDECAAALSRESEAYAALIEDQRAFKDAILGRIQATRNALKLPTVETLEG